MSHQRYISNNIPPQSPGREPSEYLKASLEAVLRETPPRTYYQDSHLGGLYTGYTGLAYLFLCISSIHPDLEVMGHDAKFWAARYLKGTREHLRIRRGNCGISCEKLAFEAVRACVTQEPGDVVEFVSSAPSLIGPYASGEDDPFGSDVVTGRAGALYLMRMVKHWVPSMAACIDSPIDRLIEKIMDEDDAGDCKWLWHGKRYFGAAHGDIGIITQLVLAKPSLASQFAPRLKELLDLQRDGNWPSSQVDGQNGRRDLIQWCHGAPGFIYSLQALRPHFPAMRPSHPDMRIRIDAAIADAQELVWEKGLLTKEPSLCHGILGNALVLPRGPRRDHFLGLATPEAVKKVKAQDPKTFEPATCGGKAPGVMMHYGTSAAWAWAVCEQESPGMIMYSDI